MSLPDGVPAYRILNSANLTLEDRKTYRATLVELKYEEMKKQLLKIFYERVSSSTGNVTVKEEVFEALSKDQMYYSYKGRSQRGGRPGVDGRSRARRFRGVNENNGRRFNPRNQFGNASKCNICESIIHWAKDCSDIHGSQNEDKQVYQTRSTTSDSHNHAEGTQEADMWFQSPDLDKV